VLVKIVQGKPGELSTTATLLREIDVPIQPTSIDEDRVRVRGRYTEEGLLELTVTDDVLGKPVADSFVYAQGLDKANGGDLDEYKVDD